MPCGAINTIDQVFAEPQVTARGAVETMTRADGGAVRLTANPVRMSETPPRARLAPPLLGQDTEAVLAELLDAGESDFARWRAARCARRKSPGRRRQGLIDAPSPLGLIKIR